MKNTYLLGIGCVSSYGNSVEKIWEKLNSKKDEWIKYGIPYEFQCELKGSLKRRADRDSLIGVYVTQESFKDAGVTLDETMEYQVGTIFSSGHGPAETNLKFADQVSDYIPECCSPFTFSNTVTNALLGYICIPSKYKGVSTMLYGCNSIPFSIDLLEEGKADLIFAGAVEAYCDELIESYQKYSNLGNKMIAEGAVTFLLSNNPAYKQQSYCFIKGCMEINLGISVYDYKGDKEDDVKKRVLHNIVKVSEYAAEDIDLVFTAGGNQDFETLENEAVKEAISKAEIVENIKELFGETMGCSIHVNIMVAALCIKNNLIPEQLLPVKERKINNIIVNGYDNLGNYVSFLISRS